MKTLFLDIDGVLSTQKARRDFAAKMPRLPNGKPRLDGLAGHCIALLNKLLNETGSKVVLSSTWRLPNPDQFWAGTPQAVERLREEGFTGEIIGETEDSRAWPVEKWARKMWAPGLPSDPFSRRRTVEIQEWLNEAQARGIVTERFVILDDMRDFGHLRRHHVISNDLHGFSPKQFRRALKLLNE